MEPQGRPATPARRLIVVADDLTGAVETAALLVGPDGAKPTVVLGPHCPAGLPEGAGALVFDADLRSLAAPQAEERVRELLRRFPGDADVFVKVDSLLRGPVAAVVSALRERRPIVCTAVPATGRSVVGGVVLLDAIPLHETDAWHLEAGAAPDSVAAALGRESAPVDLRQIRGGSLRAALAASRGVMVADAETDADLDLLAAAAPGAMVGAAGLARAWAARNAHVPVPDCQKLTMAARPDPLCLIGTATRQAAAQVDLCEQAGIEVLRMEPAALAGAEIPAGVPVVVAVRPSDGDSRSVEKAFAALARRTLADRDLVVSGGATARAVLVGLGISTLTPVAEVHPGAVVSRAPDGRRVVTRPGSYGDPTSLRAIIACLAHTTRRSTP